MGWGCHGSEEGVSSICEELGLEKGGGGGKVEEEEITLRDTTRISEFQTFETTRVSVVLSNYVGYLVLETLGH